MTEQDMEALARRWFEEVWNQRSKAAIEELMAPDAISNLENGPADRATFIQTHHQLCGAFTDLHVEIEKLGIVDGEVAVRWRLTGTHDGFGLQIPPTKQPIDYRGTTWFTMKDGQVTGGYDNWNMGRLFMQITVPEPKPAGVS